MLYSSEYTPMLPCKVLSPSTSSKTKGAEGGISYSDISQAIDLMITIPFSTSFVENPFLKKVINTLFYVNNWCYYSSFKYLSKFRNFLTFVAAFIENKTNNDNHYFCYGSFPLCFLWVEVYVHSCHLIHKLFCSCSCYTYEMLKNLPNVKNLKRQGKTQICMKLITNFP